MWILRPDRNQTETQDPRDQKPVYISDVKRAAGISCLMLVLDATRHILKDRQQYKMIFVQDNVTRRAAQHRRHRRAFGNSGEHPGMPPTPRARQQRSSPSSIPEDEEGSTNVREIELVNVTRLE